MGRYMKYEIKGSYKFILGVLAIVLILTTVFYSYQFKQANMGVIGGVAYLIMFVALFAAFLYIVDSFRKELYEDRGYLTFTLPLTGNQILGSKLLVALMWFIILGVVILLYNGFMLSRFIEFDISFREIVSVFNTETVAVGMTMFISGVVTLILIYFSMALGRVTFRNKKIGGMWFVIFLILNGLIGYTTLKITQAVPYYLDLNSFKVVTQRAINQMSMLGSMNFMSINNASMIVSAGGRTFMNIGSLVYTIVIGVAAFLSTGYLIENKINL